VHRRETALLAIMATLVIAASAACSSASSGSAGANNAANQKNSLGVSFDKTLYNELPASIKQSKSIVAAGIPDVPFIIVGASGNQTGILPELFPYLDKILGVKFSEVIAGGIAPMTLGVGSGRYQMAMGTYLDNTAAENGYDFVDDVDALQAYMYNKQDGIATSLLSFCGKTVSTVADAPPTVAMAKLLAAKCTAAGKPVEKMEYLSSPVAGVVAVQSSRAYATQLNGWEGGYYAIQNPNFANYIVPGSIVPGIICGQFFSSKNAGLAKAYLQALTILDKDGVLPRLFAKFGIPSSTVLPTPRFNDAKANANA
jgi:polar amino acid transport system substrate-binding protein